MSYIDLQNATKNPSLYRNNSIGFLDKAYYENKNTSDWAADYDFIDWAQDATRDYYRSLQKGQMQTSQDKMTVNKQNIDDSQKLLELYDQLDQVDSKDQVAIIQNEIRNITDTMRKNGSWSYQADPNRDQLQGIINDNQKQYDENYKQYLGDLEELNQSYKNYDISQYYTRKSNDATAGWGNFFYKMPSTMGTSNTSALYQTTSMLAGWGGFVAGSKLGAAIGAAAGPVGAAAGAVLGSIISIGAAQLFGGITSRENESHMEAFNGYSEKVQQLAEKRNVDLQPVINNTKQQLAKKGVDVTYLNDNEIIQAALADGDIISGSSEFDQIAKEAYLGTRRIYEQNNALGFGEALSDLSYFIPLGKYLTGTAKTVGKFAYKTIGSPFKQAMANRMAQGLQVANLGSNLRKKVIADKLFDFATGSVWRSAVEASEEGAQNVIIKKYMNDEYADDYANSSFYDALTDGQLVEDTIDNLWLRAKTLGAAFNINHEYENDAQLFEEMMGGALLPFFSPQGVIGSGLNARKTFNDITQSKRVGDYVATALMQQDEINRNSDFYKKIREGMNNGTYLDMLDRISNMLKQKGSDGKTTQYNLDTTVLTKDGSIPKDTDIDEFINEQREEYNNLISHKKQSAKQLNELNLDVEDEDLLLALSWNAKTELSKAMALKVKEGLVAGNNAITLLENEDFKNKAKQLLKKDNLTDVQLLQIATLLIDKQVQQYYDRLTDQSIAETQIKAALAQGRISKYTGLFDATNSLNQTLSENRKSKKRIKDDISRLAKELDVTEDVLNELDEHLISDTELFKNIQNNSKNRGILNIISPLLQEKSEKLQSVDKEYISQQITKYRQAQHIQNKLADAVNEASRKHSEDVEEINETKSPKQLEDEVTALQDAQVTEQQQLIQQDINNTISQFETLLNSIPQESVLHNIVDEVNKGRDIVGTDALSYARYLKNLMNKLSKRYTDKKDTEGISDQDKQNLDKLQKAAKHLGDQLTRLTDLVDEDNARTQRHNPNFPSDSTVWFDENGDRYSFDFTNSEYSEKEGLLLRGRKIAQNSEKDRINEQINTLESELKLLDSQEDEASKQAATSLRKTISKLKEAALAIDFSNQFTVKSDDPFLQTLTSKDNLGNTKQFSNKLKRLVNSVNQDIEANKKSRNRKRNIDSVDGDTFEFNLDNETGKKHGPLHQQDLIEKSKDRPLMIKGYPLNNSMGARISTMLSNPYYASKFWRGFITMPYQSSDEAKQEISKDFAILKKFGRTLNRYKAIDDFNKIGRQIAYLREQGKATDDIIENINKLANGEVDSITIGLAKLSKDDYDNMVYALPVRIYFNQKRVGNKWSYVVGADFAGYAYSTEPSKAELDSRSELIHNLWYNYKKVEKKEDVEGLETESFKPEYTNKIGFQPGDMIVTNGGYNYQVTTMVNPNLNIYQNEAGQTMTSKEIDEKYEGELPEAITKVSAHLDELVQLAKEIGYSNVDVKSLNEPLSDEQQGTTKLAHLLKGLAKYADGLVDLHSTFIPKYVIPTLGQAEKRGTKVQSANTERAKQLLSFAQKYSPELFLSYKNYQDDNNLTPSVEDTVQEALSNRWFNSKNSLSIELNGEAVSTLDTQDNRDLLVRIGNTIEKLIRDSHDSQEFMDKLDILGYNFKKNGNSEEGNSILSQYFDNRRFSRLSRPTNVMQAITMGTAEPLNNIDYNNFNRIAKHEQSKLNQIQALGLTKSSDGQYVFSLTDWLKRNAQDEESAEGRQLESEVRKQELQTEQESLQKTVRSIKKKTELIKFIGDNEGLLGKELYDQLVRVNRKGEFVLKNDNAGATKSQIIAKINEVYDERINQVNAQLEKELEEEISKNEFEGKKVSPVIFGYGSYDSEVGSNIVYFNNKGEKVLVKDANGTPGAIYLIVPSFLSSSRRHTIVHLNPKRFDRTTATFLASVLKGINDGKYNLSGYAKDIEVEGFKVDTDMSVKQLLDAFIYTGTEAIANNPSDNNYARLLYIDKQGVHFGQRLLNENNFEELINFIIQNKTYRIDREKLAGPSVLGNNLKVQDESGNVLFDHKADEIYSTILIDDGIVQTDLNRTSNAITVKPSVYVNYKKKVTFVSSAQRAQDSGTSADAKQKLGEEINSDQLYDEMTNQESKGGVKEAQKYIENFLKGFKDRINNFAKDGKLQPGKYKVAVYGMRSKRITATYDADLSVDTDTGQLSIAISEQPQFIARLIKALVNKKQVQLVLADEEGKFVQIDGKSIFFGKGFEHTNFDIDTKQVSSQSSEQGNLLQQLVEAIQQLVSNANTVPQQPVQQVVHNQPQNNLPVGYNGFNTPVENIPVQQTTVGNTTVKFEDEPSQDIKVNVQEIGDDLKMSFNGITVQIPKDSSSSDLEIALSSQEDITDEDYDSFISALEEYKQKSESDVETQTELKGLNLRPTPISQFVTPQQEKPQLQSVQELIEFLKKGSSTDKNNAKRLENLRNSENVDAAKDIISGALAIWGVQNKLYSSRSEALFDNNISRLADQFSRELVYQDGVNTGAIFDFLDQHVQKEDYDSALDRVNTILGKDFDFSFLPEGKRVWDKVREAQIYVFGECAASGIRLYRDAKLNKIARGSFYHEAFHRISLFVLSKEQRNKMYNDARNRNTDLAFATNQQIEEYLADRFSEFVIESSQEHPDKYYEGNIFSKMFQRIADVVRNIVRKLSGKNINPNYSNLDKLFKDMYSGRFAYAKATKNNIEEFEKMYSKAPVYSGFKVNNVVLAEDAIQYNEIMRDMLGKLIYNSGIYTNTDGRLSINTNALKASYQHDITTYTKAVIELDKQLRNKKIDKGLSRFNDDDVAVAQAKMVRLINVYKNIVEDKAWDQWADIIRNFVERQFNLVQDTSHNSNKVLKADIKEDVEITEEGQDELQEYGIDVLGFSDYRDSYMRDMYNSMDASMKMLLWSITDLDPTDAATAKYTPDGILKFANVRDLYTRIVHAITNSNSVEDMLNRLYSAAKTQMEEENSSTMMQVYHILSNENTNSALLNRFFTDFVKYIHNFETHSYTTTARNVGSNGEYRYGATTKNGSLDTIQSKLDNKWKGSMTVALDIIADKLNSATSTSDAGKLFRSMIAPLKQAMNKLNVENLQSIKDVLREADKLYQFGTITGDLQQDAVAWQKAMRNASKSGKVGKNLLIQPLNKLNISNVSEFKLLESSNKRQQGVYKKLDDMFTEKGILTQLSQMFGSYVKSMPSTQSQKGPGNTKIYSIGQYNFITRTFAILANTREWISKMLNNAYNSHSVWLNTLKNLGGAKQVQVHTKLSTVLDDEWNDSVADKEVTELEDLMNRFISIWSGKHVTPALANKRFAADIEGIPMFENIINNNLDINPKIIDVFVGYLADEIMAISDARYTRDYFIEKLNETTGGNYTIDSFSKLSSLQQEQIFKNNPEAAKLLRLLVKTYHYVEGEQQWLYDEENNRYYRRAFHIDLRSGKKGPRGYEFRHFKEIGKSINLSSNMVQKISSNMFDTDSRQSSIDYIYSMINRESIRAQIRSMLNDNIAYAIVKLQQLKAIVVDDAGNITSNRYLPSDLIKKYIYDKQSVNVNELSGNDYYIAIGSAVIQGMSDISEFEKLCHGDIAYHKNIDGVTKRYSGIVSTTSLTSEKGTMRNAFDEEDRLFDSSTYNSVTLNTTMVVNQAKYKGEAYRALGLSEDMIKIYLEDNNIKVSIDTSDVLDANGNIKDNYRKAKLINRLLQFRDEKRLKVMINGEPMSDAQLLDVAVKDFENRYEGYLKNDPSDAQSWVTSQMFRALQQRKGAWNDVSEAIYNLLTYYDKFGSDKLTPRTIRLIQNNICKVLNIDYNELVKRAKVYDANKADLNSKEVRDYKGWIFGIADKFKFESPSLKYIYYGYDQGRMDGLTTPIYDKSSYKVLWKIEVEGHEVQQLYDFMQSNDVDVVKQETAVKSGGLPNFELFDSNGKVDRAALNASVIQSQYFSLLGDQLNTASHHTNDANLLTQFMKVAMMNTTKDRRYRVNGTTIDGQKLQTFYKTILDELTRRGSDKFNKKWGIDSNGIVDKKAFMKSLQTMAQTENLPAETVAAFQVDENGEFKIHPAAMPNIAWIMSRILAQMGDTIIDTVTPGKALYQVTSVGYDNFMNLKQHADKHLYMPGEIDANGNVHQRMQVRLSINFFDDVIQEAKRSKVKGYDFDNFEDQRRFILDNKELFALSYRVPTQGQNSTIPIEIVDLAPSLNGSMIQFPSGITALTGSDFDIDKMFLARYNYEVVNGKMQKIKYDINEVINNINNTDSKKLQNFLLDMYQGVLTSLDHALATSTPLDVATGPISTFAKKELEVFSGGKADGLPDNLDGFYLNPVFQTRQKKLNSGSDAGIGPMALNSVFQFFVQIAKLDMRKFPIIEQLGLQKLGETFDRYGEEILDSTSGLINAFVDAAKDNYIGNANVNAYTFDVVAMLVASGFGNDTFAFLTQPIIKKISDNWLTYKQGLIGVSDQEKSGTYFMDSVIEDYNDRLKSLNAEDTPEKEYSELTKHDVLMGNLRPKSDARWIKDQLTYANMFKQLYELAKEYHNAISNAQIDTKKYGVNINQLLSFTQGVDQFNSQYNIAFSNPRDMYDNTFLGAKYTKGIMGMFDTFSKLLPEFSKVYVDAATELSKEWGLYGRQSKEFLRVVGPKIKTVLYLPFFNQYIIERFGGKALAKLTYGENSVPGRYETIKRKALRRGEGVDLFNAVKYNKLGDARVPQFMLVTQQFKEDADVKNNVQLALSELFNSTDPEIKQWAEDFAVYMFYVSGGTDSNAGGIVRTTIYDIIPPQYLANLKAGGKTFNQYIAENVMGRTTGMNNTEKDHIISLLAVSDDNYVPTISPRNHKYIIKRVVGNDVITITKGSNSLFNRSTNTYKPFIKIATSNGYDLYRLGERVSSVSKKTGTTFSNPVYYKVNKLGYKSSKRQSFALRADGYISSQDGTIRSLLWQDNDFNKLGFNDLNEKEQSIYMNNTNTTLDKIDDALQGNIDYSKYFDSQNANDTPEQQRALVDTVDTIYFIADGSFSHHLPVRDYARFKNKEFYVISTDQTEIPTANGYKIAIVGDSANTAIEIYKNNSDKQIYTFVNYFGEQSPVFQALYNQIGNELNNNQESEDSDQRGNTIKNKCKN